MKGLPKKDFSQFRTTPLEMKPFSPKTALFAQKYINKINKVIKDTNTIVKLRGSTAFKILGKGDIDIAVYTSNKNYRTTLEQLIHFFDQPTATGKDFAAFQFEDHKYEIEVSIMKGYEVKVDLKLTDFLLNNPKMLNEYELLKKKYCYSKREYVVQRDRFMRKIIKNLND